MIIQELSESFQPPRILYRDKQIKAIREVFKNHEKKQSEGNNIIILGVTGSGKTSTFKKLLKEKNNYLFINGSSTRTSYKTLKALFGNLEISNIIKNLQRNPKIIVIDEVDKIKDVYNLFNDLNTIYRETRCPIIVITNKRTIINEIPDDARLTLFFKKIDFPAYNAIELFGIVKDRLNSSSHSIPRKSLKYICAVGAKDGSARIVLNLTRNCIINNDFSERFIRKQIKEREKEEWTLFIDNLIETERKFLKVLLESYSLKKEILNSDILKRMKDLTPGRISQLITAFEGYGILETEYKNLGRTGGRFRVAKFVSKEIYEKLDKLVEV